MAKLVDVKIDDREKNRPTKAITIDAETVELIRRVAHRDGLRMSAFLDKALRAYIARYHPDWEVVDEDGNVSRPESPPFRPTPALQHLPDPGRSSLGTEVEVPEPDVPPTPRLPAKSSNATPSRKRVRKKAARKAEKTKKTGLR